MLSRFGCLLVFALFTPFVYSCNEERVAIDSFLACVEDDPKRDFYGFCGAVVTVEYSPSELLSCLRGEMKTFEGGSGPVVFFDCNSDQKISVNLTAEKDGYVVTAVDEVLD